MSVHNFSFDMLLISIIVFELIALNRASNDGCPGFYKSGQFNGEEVCIYTEQFSYNGHDPFTTLYEVQHFCKG